MDWREGVPEIFFTYGIPPLLIWAAVDLWMRKDKTTADWIRAIVLTVAALLAVWRSADLLA